MPTMCQVHCRHFKYVILEYLKDKKSSELFYEVPVPNTDEPCCQTFTVLYAL